jgi:hypothetical protein
MSRRARVSLGVVLLTPFACLAVVGTQGCPRNPGCAAAGPLMQAMGVGSRALQAAIVGVALLTVLRFASTLRVTASACSRLSVVPTPATLRAAQLRTGVGRVRCVADAPLAAFCHGGVWPVIVVTATTVDALERSALDAVLLHEETHRQRRDPLRRALRRALTDVAPQSRLLVACNTRAVIREELRADARAARQLGRPAVARALLAMAPVGSEPNALPGFGDAAGPRVEQLLGGIPQLPTIPIDSVVGAAAAAAAVLALLLCTLPGAT